MTKATSVRLRRFSRAMVVITSLAMTALVIAFALVFTIPDWTQRLLAARFNSAAGTLDVGSGHLAAAAAVLAIPFGVMLYGLARVRALFQDFSRGAIFTPQAARKLRDFAAAVLAQSVLGPLSTTAMMLALTLNNPAMKPQLVIALSSQDLIALIVGATLLAIAWVMVEAASLADENASFV